MSIKNLITTALTIVLVSPIFGQNIVQDVANQSCKCVEKDTFETMEAKVQNCIAGILTKNMQKYVYYMANADTLKQTLSDIKMRVFTECNYVVLAQEKTRKAFYNGSKSEKAAAEFRKGNGFLIQDNYVKALPFFQKAVEIDPNFIEAIDHIALCYRRTDDLKNAEKFYKKSLDIAPKGQTAAQNLATVYSLQRKPKEAIQQYQALLDTDLSNPEAYFGIARILLENNTKLDKALELTDKALNIYRITKDPNYKDGLLMKGLIYYYSKDNKNAKKFLEEAKLKGVEIPAQLIKELKIN